MLLCDSSDLIFFSTNYEFCIQIFNVGFNPATIFSVVFIISFVFSFHCLAIWAHFFLISFCPLSQRCALKKKILLNMPRSFKIFSFGFSSKWFLRGLSLKHSKWYLFYFVCNMFFLRDSLYYYFLSSLLLGHYTYSVFSSTLYTGFTLSPAHCNLGLLLQIYS